MMLIRKFSFTIYFFHYFPTFIVIAKYKVVTDNPWLYVWIADAIIFAIYAYAWDVRQDFDLWDCSAQVNSKFLRDELIYESKVSSSTLVVVFDFHNTKTLFLSIGILLVWNI